MAKIAAADAAAAATAAAVEKVKDFWNAQVNDEQKWELNSKLLRAVGMFAGSIFIMRKFGDLMAI